MSSPAIPLLAAFIERHDTAKKQFAKEHEAANRWLKEKGLDLDTIRQHSQKLLVSATVGGALLLVSPKIPLPFANETSFAVKMHDSIDNFLSRMKTISSQGLSLQTEEEITENIKNLYGVSTSFELDHNRLPDYVGLMGLEQHLYRSPTDTLHQHDAYLEAGIAPARGAFGYFVREGVSEEQMIREEKYYVVLQTFKIPQWNSDWAHLKPWYAYRKFLVINLENGKAVVAVLGDSGPGVSTGKVFGGSPEVMYDLGWYPKKTKGKVMMLFLDDPINSIPLGPVELKK